LSCISDPITAVIPVACSFTRTSRMFYLTPNTLYMISGTPETLKHVKYKKMKVTL